MRRRATKAKVLEGFELPSFYARRCCEVYNGLDDDLPLCGKTRIRCMLRMLDSREYGLGGDVGC
jgi:hypothetical protein